LARFQATLATLEEACRTATNELERDGTIQRFEFTFELGWKCLGALLVHEGFNVAAGPRTVLKEAARRGFLQEAEEFLDMLEDRNLTAHIYQSALAEEIFARIRTEHAPRLHSLAAHLSSRVG